MTYRQVHFHELADQEWVSIAIKGEITLDILEDIELFCHRQRVRLCLKMSEQLAKPAADSGDANGPEVQK